MNSANQVKVQFDADPSDGRGIRTESLWAERVGPGQFRILNSPFFLFGISADDIVAADDGEEGLKFRNVVSRGGHSTYRVYLQDGRTIQGEDFLRYWRPSAMLGATFENADNHFIAVDIPPGKDVAAIYDLLEKGEHDGIWAFEEVHYADPLER